MQIKYRVWDKTERRFVPGEPAYLISQNLLLSPDGSLYRWWLKSSTLAPADKDRYEVSLWTGYTDKNGRLIYEGDLLRMEVPPTGRTELALTTWDEQLGRWIFRGKGFMLSLYMSDCQNVEVVANRYEHREKVIQ